MLRRARRLDQGMRRQVHAYLHVFGGKHAEQQTEGFEATVVSQPVRFTYSSVMLGF